MNKKRIIFVTILALVVIFTTAFFWYKNTVEVSLSRPNQNTNQISNTQNHIKPSVITSFYPLFEFSKQVAGNSANIENITPPGVEPHDFEPSSQQISKIQESQIFIYNGGEIDVWAEKLAPELSKKNVKVIKMSDVLQTDLIFSQENKESGFDPHFWLDPVLALKQADIITQALSEVDSKNTNIYKANLTKFSQQLSDLDGNYKSNLNNCSLKTVVTSHNAFAYLARRYGFKLVSVSGLSPDAEPSLEKITEIVKLVEEKKIKYIAFESLVSPKISQTIAAETGTATIALNPIEGLTQEEMDNNQNYLSLMQDNLNNLRFILDCK